MGKQNAQSTAALAEKLFRSACLITGDALSAEQLVLDTLRKECLMTPAFVSPHTHEMTLYRRLVRGCLFAAASASVGQSPLGSELKSLSRLKRAVVVLSGFSGFDEAAAARILGMPPFCYAWLLKKATHELAYAQQMAAATPCMPLTKD